MADCKPFANPRLYTKWELTVDTKKFMAAAVQLAGAALEKGELPIGAVVVLDDQIVAQAHTSEVADRRLLVHAELQALLGFDQLHLNTEQRRRSALFSTLEPCLMCLGACQASQVGEVYFALESWIDGASEVTLRLERESQDYPEQFWPVVEGGILREESRELVADYLSKHSSGAMRRWAKALIDGQPRG